MDDLSLIDTILVVIALWLAIILPLLAAGWSWVHFNLTDKIKYWWKRYYYYRNNIEVILLVRPTGDKRIVERFENQDGLYFTWHPAFDTKAVANAHETITGEDPTLWLGIDGTVRSGLTRNSWTQWRKF